MNEKPYLSIVVAARNDNYGVNFLERFQIFIKCLVESLEKYALPSEVVVVEWNPPEDQKPLKEVINWPPSRQFCSIRIIEVPKAIHTTLPNSDKFPMFEYFAKNVGIKRANGNFVLATNPDIIFTEELIELFSKKILNDSSFYRIDRFDFNGRFDLNLDTKTMINDAKNHIFAVIRYNKGKCCLCKIHFPRIFNYFNKWPRSKIGWFPRKSNCEFIEFKDPNGEWEGLNLGAAGDFILTAKSNWEKIHGFPEYTDSYSHLDNYGVHQLRAIGLNQIVIIPPCMILHYDHSREEQKKRPIFSAMRYQDDWNKLFNGSMDPTINDEGWGFGKYILEEFTF